MTSRIGGIVPRANPCGCPPKASTGPSVLGQRVKIMEGVTNSGAGGQRVHIADVGNWAVGRVSQTVHIRPEEEPCECADEMYDDFERTEAAGWGTSTPTGHVWDAAIPAQASVSGSRGLLQAGASTTSDARMDSDDVPGYGSDRTYKVQFSVDGVTGNPGNPNSYQRLLQFGDQSSGEVRIIVRTNGPDAGPLLVMTDSDLTDTTVPVALLADTEYILIFKTFSNSGDYAAKLYAASDPEPSTWLVESTATPYTNLTELHLEIHEFWNGSGDRTLSIEHIAINNNCLFDDFSREEASDWGTATPSGVVWAYGGTLPMAGVALSVASGVGVAVIDSGAGATFYLPESLQWTDPEGFVMTHDFLTGTIPSSSFEHIAWYDEDAIDLFLDIDVSSNATAGLVSIYGGIAYADAVKTDWIADTWYRVKVEYRPLSGIARAKVWPRAGTEPGWLVSAASTGAALAGRLTLELANFGIPSGYTFALDNITFTTCPED